MERRCCGVVNRRRPRGVWHVGLKNNALLSQPQTEPNTNTIFQPNTADFITFEHPFRREPRGDADGDVVAAAAVAAAPRLRPRPAGRRPEAHLGQRHDGPRHQQDAERVIGEEDPIDLSPGEKTGILGSSGGKLTILSVY